MENIKLEDLKPGMKVRIVSERGKNQNPRMDKWLGEVMMESHFVEWIYPIASIAA